MLSPESVRQDVSNDNVAILHAAHTQLFDYHSRWTHTYLDLMFGCDNEAYREILPHVR